MKKMTLEQAMREHGKWFGREYGSTGGKISSANMTPEQRRARALKANAASQESKRRKREEREKRLRGV